MLYRDFGQTGLQVSALGFGAGQIGGERLTEEEVGRLLNQVVDWGITLIDTARGYGRSEERIGRHLAHRRHEIVLSTKVGYSIPGHADWTFGCVQAGVDTALRQLNTDYLDIVHLHSCPLATLQQGDVIRALEEAVQMGKVRVMAYSGENDALQWAVASGKFGSVEHSLNICDQRVIQETLPVTTAKGMGVIAKRPVANAPWRFGQRPFGDYAEQYWLRWQTMNLDPRGLDWQELALRFAAFTPGVYSCIVGTANEAHVRQNLALLEKGALDGEHRAMVEQAFTRHDPGWWVGQV